MLPLCVAMSLLQHSNKLAISHPGMKSVYPFFTAGESQMHFIAMIDRMTGYILASAFVSFLTFFFCLAVMKPMSVTMMIFNVDCEARVQVRIKDAY